MDDIGLQRRLEECRADYVRQTGNPFDHFFCPILLRDEQVELCRGHISNDALNGKEWVPQRKDVDNFYGSAVEADLVKIIEDRKKDSFAIFTDPKLRKKHRPRIEFGGEPCDYYFPKSDAPSVPGHSRVTLVSGEVDLCNMAIKVGAETLLAGAEKSFELIVEGNSQPQVVAAMLKAAHLTLFKMLGYKHVLSPSGLYLADILRKFYERYKPAIKVQHDDVEKYFMPFSQMVFPFYVEDKQLLQGTAIDNRVLTCLTASEEIFAIGVIIKAGGDSFCVVLPTDCGKSINTYFSFLNEPPPSIAARVIQFFQGDERDSGYWEAAGGDPIRIPLNQPMPDE